MVFPHSHANCKYLQSPGKQETKANEAAGSAGSGAVRQEGHLFRSTLQEQSPPPGPDQQAQQLSPTLLPS